MTTTTNGMVTLNVGGRLFHTTKSTLLGVDTEPNFFHSLLSERLNSVKDEAGHYFIDRNGDLFAVVLELLRTGVLEVPEGVSNDAVMRELGFYCVQLPPPPVPKTTSIQCGGLYAGFRCESWSGIDEMLRFLPSGSVECWNKNGTSEDLMWVKTIGTYEQFSTSFVNIVHDNPRRQSVEDTLPSTKSAIVFHRHLETVTPDRKLLTFLKSTAPRSHVPYHTIHPNTNGACWMCFDMEAHTVAVFITSRNNRLTVARTAAFTCALGEDSLYHISIDDSNFPNCDIVCLGERLVEFVHMRPVIMPQNQRCQPVFYEIVRGPTIKPGNAQCFQDILLGTPEAVEE